MIGSSPKRDKKVYIVSLFPRNQDELPENLADIWHRARDIMHTDKTEQWENVKGHLEVPLATEGDA